MLYKGDRFAPSGVAEYFKLIFTTLGAGAQIGLNISLSVLIGSHFRYHAPWAFYLAIALACAWTLSLFLLITSLSRLVRFLNRSRDALKSSRSSLILPLGAESLAAAVGSALLSSAVVWISRDVIYQTGQSAQERLAQFDVYFPISIGFQILALPGFVKLADIFSYAEAKARKEVELASRRSDLDKQKQALQSTSTGGSLISADSLRAAQKEIGLARARLLQQEKALNSISTGGSAQTVVPQRVFTRPLLPTPEYDNQEDRRKDSFPYEYNSAAPPALRPQDNRVRLSQNLDDVAKFDDDFSDDLEAQPDGRVDIYSSLPARPTRSWIG